MAEKEQYKGPVPEGETPQLQQPMKEEAEKANLDAAGGDQKEATEDLQKARGAEEDGGKALDPNFGMNRGGEVPNNEPQQDANDATPERPDVAQDPETATPEAEADFQHAKAVERGENPDENS